MSIFAALYFTLRLFNSAALLNLIQLLVKRILANSITFFSESSVDEVTNWKNSKKQMKRWIFSEVKMYQ